MTDNVLLNIGTGGDSLAADNVSTLNGAASSVPKVQRAKVTFGLPGTATDVSAANPMPVTFTASSAPPANNAWGQALAQTAGATATIASLTAPAGYRVKGLVAHGTGDGYWFVQISSATVLSGRTRATAPMLVISLPDGISVATGSVVALKVTNESGSTADYEATLLGA